MLRLSVRHFSMVALVSAALAIAPAGSALAVDPPSGGGGGGAPPTNAATYALSTPAVTQGDSLDVTFTPGTYGLRDFCNYSSYESSSLNSGPGFSAFLQFDDGVNQINVGLQPSGQGQGSFTPTIQSVPMTVSFTVPADLPAATYTVRVTCVGPTSPFYYTWTSVPEVSFGSVTVAAAPETPTEDAETPAVTALPDTGLNDASSAAALGGAFGLIALGLRLGTTTRRRKRASL